MWLPNLYITRVVVFHLFSQIHLEDRQSAKKSDEAKYREALEAARREVRGHFEASIEELKERHKLELQEGKDILGGNLCFSFFLSVVSSKISNILTTCSYPAAPGQHQQCQEPDGERVKAALAADAERLRGGGARARAGDRAAEGGLRAVDEGERGAASHQDQRIPRQGQRLAARKAGGLRYLRNGVYSTSFI